MRKCLYVSKCGVCVCVWIRVCHSSCVPKDRVHFFLHRMDSGVWVHVWQLQQAPLSTEPSLKLLLPIAIAAGAATNPEVYRLDPGYKGKRSM